MYRAAVQEDPVGSAPMSSQEVLSPDDVAQAVIDGLREERFLILPHPQVADYMALKGADPGRWQGGMRKLLREARAAHPNGG